MNLDQLLPASEHEAFHQASLSYSDRCIRKHVRRLDSELPFSVTEVPWYLLGRFLVDSSIRPASFLEYATADYYIQDAASLLPLALIDLQEDDLICDLCASPGGKSSAIAERLGPNGFLLANESIRSRVDVLKYSLVKTGNPCFAVSSYDPDDLASLVPNAFDVVLVDAPCSGQTLVARKKRDDNAYSASQIEHCALRQQRILESAIRMLKVGGRLVYSTCTFATEENEAQIQRLHTQYPNAWEPIEPVGLAPWRSPVQSGCYRLWPHRDHCSGGFAAGLRLVKELDLEPIATANRTAKKWDAKSSKGADRSELLKQKSAREALLALGAFSNVTTEWRNGHLQCMMPSVRNAVNEYRQVAMEPMAVLIESGNHFVPTQGLALLDPGIFVPNRTVELESSQATQFANGESIPLSTIESQSSTKSASAWAVAKWNSRPLGWCKALSNRLNNHLPPWARLNLS
jgi:16S rRNA C967 or C1407 C5-methylase (RsmB/RsmF family)